MVMAPREGETEAQRHQALRWIIKPISNPLAHRPWGCRMSSSPARGAETPPAREAGTCTASLVGPVLGGRCAWEHGRLGWPVWTLTAVTAQLSSQPSTSTSASHVDTPPWTAQPARPQGSQELSKSWAIIKGLL